MSLNIEEIGLLETLHYKEWDQYKSELELDEVEVEIRAIGVNFVDLLTVLGRIRQNELGAECAGIVKRVCSGCQHLQTRDHIAILTLNYYKTTVIFNEELYLPIPQGMTFAHAAYMPIKETTRPYTKRTYNAWWRTLS